MTKKSFAHLHLHTLFSFLDGTIKIENLFKKMCELDMKQIAVTDHGNMYGVGEFYINAKKYNIKPILGMEAHIINEEEEKKQMERKKERERKKREEKKKKKDKNKKEEEEEEKIKDFHLILLAENKTGYENLLKMVAFANMYDKQPVTRVTKKTLFDFKEGVIALSACQDGEIAKNLIKNNFIRAIQAAKEYKKIYGNKNFFLEIQISKIPKQIILNKNIISIGKILNLKTLCTNNCHYILKEDKHAHNILINMRKYNKNIDYESNERHSSANLYVKTAEETMKEAGTEYKEMYEMTCEVSERCNVEIQVGRDSIPLMKIPREFTTHAEYLNHLTYKSMSNKFNKMLYKLENSVYLLRLYSELRIINDMGYSNYFLIVYNFVNWAKNNKIKVGPGRGSSSGSLVSFCLRITNLDPLINGLVFERFLNPERASMPDFDIDFMQDKRDKIIKYVASLYGIQNVGQIATFSKFTPKSTIKDVSKAMGISFEEINMITKELPILVDGEKPNFEQLMDFAKKLKEMAENSATYQDIVNISRTLDGLYRQAGMHAAGVVISSRNLIIQSPVFIGINNEIITQFDKDCLDFFGLTKFDFLGLKTLDFIAKIEYFINRRIMKENRLGYKKKAIATIRHSHLLDTKRGDIEYIDADYIVTEDKCVFKLLSEGNTLGIFQFESPGFQELCLKLRPDCMSDIVAAAALYRPGPIQSGLLNEFIEAKHTIERVYFHEKLKDALIETYGKFVYQEQVISSAEIVAGYSTSEADIFRSAITKKDPKEILIQKEKFVKHATRRELEKEEAGAIFDYIEKFAGYGFNKSHAASYAIMTYQTAYLKAFYGVEFVAAMLDLYVTSTDDVVNYISEARRNKIKTIRPDINKSKKKFKIEYSKRMYRTIIDKKNNKYGGIRFGMEGIKGVSLLTIESIIEEKKSRPFRTIIDFYARTNNISLNKKTIQCLIKSGILDTFKDTRKFKFDTIDETLYDANIFILKTNKGQRNFFGMVKLKKKQKEINFLKKKEWPIKKLTEGEFDVMGLYITIHPLSLYEEIKNLPTELIQDARYYGLNRKTKLIIIVIEIKQKMSMGGLTRWIELNLEDRTGRMRGTCSEKIFRIYETEIVNKLPLMIFGSIYHEYKKDATFGDYVAKVRISKIKKLV